MFDAYLKTSVAAKLPLVVEAVTADESSLLIATPQRQQSNPYLLFYIPKTEGNSSAVTAYDVQTFRSFARKAVVQLKLISELNLLICLSDGFVAIYEARSSDLSSQPICTLNKTKGANVFAVKIDQIEDEEDKTPVLYLCVGVKRKLQLYCGGRGPQKEFKELSILTETSFSDVVRTLVWCDTHLAIAVRDEYFLATVFSDDKDDTPGNVRPMFTVGSKSKLPLIVPIPDYRLIGFCRDDTTVLTTYNGYMPSRQEFSDLRWSDCLQAIEYDRPFLVAMLKDTIEIRSLRPNQLIQTIPFNVAKFLARASPRSLYVVSQPGSNQSDLYHLHSEIERVEANIQLLIKEKRYELALQLADSCAAELDARDSVKRSHDIKRLYAYHLFHEKAFKEAFDLYKSIDTEVIYVIGLFPDFIPAEVRHTMAYPNGANQLTTSELLSGLQPLAAYLSEMRTNIAHDLHVQCQSKEQLRRRHVDQSVPAPNVPLKSEDEIMRMKMLLEIIDTTLLKCFLQTNDMLVASLLRLQDNSCNVAESEIALLKHNKYSELLLLYERKGMHREALQLLKSQAQNFNSGISGVDRTVLYLQNLGNENLSLIFEFAERILKENVEEGLKIFTEDCDTVKSWDRYEIMNYLYRVCRTCLIPYLEHVIHQWGEIDARFHDMLASEYVSEVRTLLSNYIRSLSQGQPMAPAGREPGKLGKVRSSLLTFLRWSASYTPELVLGCLPLEDAPMYDERAIVLGRLKHHLQAIAIYTNVLHDFQQAEQYCRTTYKRHPSPDADVYLILLRMYAQPPDNGVISVALSKQPKPQPNVSMALQVLKNYAPYIDMSQALELLPSAILLKDVWSAVESVLHSTAIRLRDLNIQKGLAYSHNLRVQGRRMAVEGTKWSINYQSICKKCAKKIGDSAFARFADGELVHYYCYKDAGSTPALTESLPDS